MPWVYLHDRWHEHPKILDAYSLDPLAPFLYLVGLTYCRRNDTDGFIPIAQVSTLLGYSPERAQILFATRLWEGAEDSSVGVTIHDYLQWNRSAEERSSNARRAAEIRWSRVRTNASDATRMGRKPRS